MATRPAWPLTRLLWLGALLAGLIGLPFVLTHKPGCMFVTDWRDERLRESLSGDSLE